MQYLCIGTYTIQKQGMNIIISFTLCSFLVYPIMFICILISLSNDRFVSCIIMCVWVHYQGLLYIYIIHTIVIWMPYVHIVSLCKDVLMLMMFGIVIKMGTNVAD